MAVTLTLAASFQEQNDNKVLVITDTTGTAVSTGWGVGDNPDYTDIDGTTYDLFLDITITTSDGTETTYDQIDLYDEFGPFAAYEDMVFNIDATMLLVDGVAFGDSDTELPDGIWEIAYSIYTGVDETDTYEITILVNGQIRIIVYEKLRQIPTTYLCQECCNTRTIKEAIFAYSYLMAIDSSAFTSKTEELLNQLYTLERMCLNGSNCTW